MENTNEDIETKSRIYEVGYLLSPNISEEEMPVIYGNLKDLIINLGGETISDEMPKMIPLAYTMSKVVQNVRSKFDTAFFGWVKFEMSREKVLELKKKLDLESNFIRFLILKTIRENTIAAKRFVFKDSKKKMYTVKKEDENESSLPIDKEEIDKEIDAMISA